MAFSASIEQRLIFTRQDQMGSSFSTFQSSEILTTKLLQINAKSVLGNCNIAKSRRHGTVLLQTAI
jgi:hypothetical protein